LNIEKLIKTERCLILNSRTKTEALHEIFDSIQNEGILKDVENIKKEIFYREQIMSTGIGQGIGIPHIRMEGISEPHIFVGICHDGIDDYESLDKLPVRIVIMILVGADQHKEYLRILSLIVGRLKDEKRVNEILDCTSPKEICKTLIGADK